MPHDSCNTSTTLTCEWGIPRPKVSSIQSHVHPDPMNILIHIVLYLGWERFRRFPISLHRIIICPYLAGPSPPSFPSFEFEPSFLCTIIVCMITVMRARLAHFFGAAAARMRCGNSQKDGRGGGRHSGQRERHKR